MRRICIEAGYYRATQWDRHPVGTPHVLIALACECALIGTDELDGTPADWAETLADHFGNPSKRAVQAIEQAIRSLAQTGEIEIDPDAMTIRVPMDRFGAERPEPAATETDAATGTVAEALTAWPQWPRAEAEIAITEIHRAYPEVDMSEAIRGARLSGGDLPPHRIRPWLREECRRMAARGEKIDYWGELRDYTGPADERMVERYNRAIVDRVEIPRAVQNTVGGWKTSGEVCVDRIGRLEMIEPGGSEDRTVEELIARFRDQKGWENGKIR